jgi:hypothetical protein
LSLLDEQFLVFRFVYPLCGPFQYSFHGYGYLDARKTKRLWPPTTLIPQIS